ncbi:MAG: OsmC family protein [Crocinitomicaceae bacterium]|jgi:uncharacterized OsmC-like protein|tara:strand:- start:41154 stop:41555 length:402 start_codon:yes stop_codon:yes gene_type:complete
MIISEVSYLGNLRTEAKHLKSNDTIITDAPVDNNGKGQAFSPTDLVATSLASCAMTIIGIYCEKNDIKFEHCDAKVEKLMGNNPRKIEQINVTFYVSKNEWDSDTLNKIIKEAKACPVSITLENQVQIDYKFL